MRTFLVVFCVNGGGVTSDQGDGHTDQEDDSSDHDEADYLYWGLIREAALLIVGFGRFRCDLVANTYIVINITI